MTADARGRNGLPRLRYLLQASLPVLVNPLGGHVLVLGFNHDVEAAIGMLVLAYEAYAREGHGNAW